MDENVNKDQDLIEANWLTNWEDQCVREFENDTNMDGEEIQRETEQHAQKLWLSFQNSATAIAQLYRDRTADDASLWLPFQNSASGVTTMYKDSLEIMKRSFELGLACGHHRHTRDFLNWAKKRRRHVRREEVIAYLCGKAPPVRSRPASSWGQSKVSVVERSSPRLPSVVESREEREDMTDLTPFRDAIALQRLNGAMSNISVGLGSRTGPPTSAERESSSSMEAGNSQADDDLHCFILDEMSRRCDNSRKRSPNNDVIMDSPTRKRSRLL